MRCNFRGPMLSIGCCEQPLARAVFGWWHTRMGRLAGQLAQPGKKAHAAPVRVPGLSGVVQVAAGHAYSCALERKGEVWCWGATTDGQPADRRHQPHKIVGLNGVKAIAAGAFVCAMTDTDVLCWGHIRAPRHGGPPALKPHRMKNLSRPKQIAVGGGHACVLSQAGEVSCWGWNHRGQVGDGRVTGANDPEVVLKGARRIFVGGMSSCALMERGPLRCWGEVADSDALTVTTPMPVRGLTDAVDIAADANRSCAVLANGKVQCWGDNDNGLLGEGTEMNRATPTPLADLSHIADIALGHGHACARSAQPTGPVQCWGAMPSPALGGAWSSASQRFEVAASVGASQAATCARLWLPAFLR